MNPAHTTHPHIPFGFWGFILSLFSHFRNDLQRIYTFTRMNPTKLLEWRLKLADSLNRNASVFLEHETGKSD